MLFAYLTSAELSDVGRRRKQNEDAVLRAPAHGVFCVADGMGGTTAGEEASAQVVRSLAAALADLNEPKSIADGAVKQKVVLEALREASASIFERAEEKGLGQSGTTAVVLTFDALKPSRAVALHAGDSRLYRFRNGSLKQLTRDHSFAQDAGYKDEKRVPEQFRGVVTRSIGIKQDVKVEVTDVDVAENDLFLLCSDGLTRMIADRDLREIFRRETPSSDLDALARQLIRTANEAGGKDNISVILIRVGPLQAAVIDEQADVAEPRAADVDSDTADTELTSPTIPDDSSAPPASHDAMATTPMEPAPEENGTHGTVQRGGGTSRVGRRVFIAVLTLGLAVGIGGMTRRCGRQREEAPMPPYEPEAPSTSTAGQPVVPSTQEAKPVEDATRTMLELLSEHRFDPGAIAEIEAEMSTSDPSEFRGGVSNALAGWMADFGAEWRKTIETGNLDEANQWLAAYRALREAPHLAAWVEDRAPGLAIESLAGTLGRRAEPDAVPSDASDALPWLGQLARLAEETQADPEGARVRAIYFEASNTLWTAIHRTATATQAAEALMERIRTVDVLDARWITATFAAVNEMEAPPLSLAQRDALTAAARDKVAELADAHARRATDAYDALQVDEGNGMLETLESVVAAVPERWRPLSLQGKLEALRIEADRAAQKMQEARSTVRESVFLLSGATPAEWTTGLERLYVVSTQKPMRAQLPRERIGDALWGSLAKYLREGDTAQSHAQRVAEVETMVQRNELLTVLPPSRHEDVRHAVDAARQAQDAWARLESLPDRAIRGDVDVLTLVLEALAAVEPSTVEEHPGLQRRYAELITAWGEGARALLGETLTASDDPVGVATRMDHLLARPAVEAMLPENELRHLRSLALQRRGETLFEQALATGRWGAYTDRESAPDGVIGTVITGRLAAASALWVARWEEASQEYVPRRRRGFYTDEWKRIEEAGRRNAVSVPTEVAPDWHLVEADWATACCRLWARGTRRLLDAIENRHAAVTAWFTPFRPDVRGTIAGIFGNEERPVEETATDLSNDVERELLRLAELTDWLDSVHGKPLPRELQEGYAGTLLAAAEKTFRTVWAAVGEQLARRLEEGEPATSSDHRDEVASLVKKIDFSKAPDVDDVSRLSAWSDLIGLLGESESNAVVSRPNQRD